MKTQSGTSLFLANTRGGLLEFIARTKLRRCLLPILVAILFSINPERVLAQASYKIWGDVKIDDSKTETPGPSTLTVILYDPSGAIMGRQTVSNGGRYRFNVLVSAGDDNAAQRGSFELAIESDAGEITRTSLNINGPGGSDFRHDFEFEWKSKSSTPKSVAGVISAADLYVRPAANKSIFQKAEGAVGKKKYDQAAALLRQIVESDKLDFQAWTLLGTVYLIQENFPESEKAYLSAIGARPTFALALIDLGKLRTRQKRFEEAIEPLTRAVETQPQSAEANLLLGESYLQIRKGSKAIGYLNEASRLGQPDAHLRLGWLYNAAGMKDKAAAEYEEFLKKRPDYSDRKRLEEYIRANKKV